MLESTPALGAAESQAKFDSLANLFEHFEKPQCRLRELLAIFIWPGAKVPQRGRGRAEVVLPTFAETKVGRLPGRTPASRKITSTPKKVDALHLTANQIPLPETRTRREGAKRIYLP